MTTLQITRILDNHGINYSVINGKVLAECCYTFNGELFTEIVDLTEVTVTQLFEWLGY